MQRKWKCELSQVAMAASTAWPLAQTSLSSARMRMPLFKTIRSFVPIVQRPRERLSADHYGQRAFHQKRAPRRLRFTLLQAFTVAHVRRTNRRSVGLVWSLRASRPRRSRRAARRRRRPRRSACFASLHCQFTEFARNRMVVRALGASAAATERIRATAK